MKATNHLNATLKRLDEERDQALRLFTNTATKAELLERLGRKVLLPRAATAAEIRRFLTNALNHRSERQEAR